MNVDRKIFAALIHELKNHFGAIKMIFQEVGRKNKLRC